MIKPYAYLACLALALAGCNSSSSDDSDNTQNGGNDNTSNDANNGTDTSDITPAEALRLSAELDYNKSYGGTNHWAQPVASFSGGQADTQQQRQMTDTALLGNALVTVPYHLIDQLLTHTGTEPTNLIDFLNQTSCGAGSVSLSSQDGSEAVGTACVQSGNGDDADILFSGQLHWDDNPAEYDLTFEFDGMDVEWRGENFAINGAGALDNERSWLLLAMDIDHPSTGNTYRYWIRHRYGLSTSQPEIDLIAFHPELGAMAQLAEAAFNGSTCDGGGYTADHAGILFNADRATEAEAVFYYGFVACDVYQISATNSTDANGDTVPPELHPAYAALGMDLAPTHEVWQNDDDSHYQLAQDNPGETLLTPTDVALAKLGTEGNEDAYTQYHLALTFDLADLPAGITNRDDVLAASLRLHQVGERTPYFFIQASPGEWTGTPDTEFEPGTPLVNLMGTSTLLEKQPWLWTDMTDWIRQALDESRPQLQILVGVAIITLEEGNASSLVCLGSDDDCTEALKPTIELIY